MNPKRTKTIREWAGRTLYAALGMLSSMLCVMGYYPLVPAFYAACCLDKRRNVLLYIGLFAGMGLSMPPSAVVKYLFVFLVIGMAIRFYLWANRRCSGWTAGVLAGIVTAAMNVSGTAALSMERREMVLGVCEGLAVFALSVLLHYGMELAAQYAWSRDGEETGEPEGLDAKGRMLAFAEAVDGLADAFVSMGGRSGAGQDLDVLAAEMTGKLCASCDGCTLCLEPPARIGYIRRLLTAVAAHRPREELLDENLMEGCKHYRSMVEEAIWAFSRMELNTAWYRRLQENRRVIAGQLDAMADMLQDWDRGVVCVDEKNRLLLARIRFEAKERGLLAGQVHVYEDRDKRRIVTALVESKWGGGIPSKNYRKALERAIRVPMRLQKGARSILTQEPVRLTAYEDTCFYAVSGVSARTKEGFSVSGDSFGMSMQENGHYSICLSDGMGSGSDALRESDMVVGLMEKFMEAGFSQETAIRLMNSAMVLQGEDEMYATLDLADIDLYGGTASVTKIGAAASFVLHRGEVSCLRADTLPAGADAAALPDALHKQLSNGDFLVMVTDGVLEYLHVKEPEEKLAQMISEIHTGNAGGFADLLMERVLLFTGGHVQDDMTVIVTGVWEKT